MTVRDKKKSLVIYSPSGYGITPGTSASSTDQLTYNEGGTGAVNRVLTSRLQEYTSVKDFGAVGDGTTDDTAAIQAALNYVGTSGGGTVMLPKTNGQYRITSGLKLPSFTCLEGSAPSRYPFNGATNSSCIKADFADKNQWVIDTSATKVSTGAAFAYNEFCNSVAPNFVYNSAVKNLQIRSVGVMPWGGIRVQGCPGATVENVSVSGCATGLLVNYTFGGSFSFHCDTPYYGVIAWENVNANNWELYCSATTPVNQTVPAGYLQPFMNSLNGVLVPTAKLSTNDHYNRSWGVIIGAAGGATSTNNVLDITVERYSGGLFQYFSYGAVFNKFYFEGSGTAEMNFACVSAFSKWVANSFHAFLTSSSCYFVDLGITNTIRLTAIGLKTGSYGFGPFLDNSSLVTIDGISPSDFGPTTPQYNMYYTAGGRFVSIASSLVNSWTSTGGLYAAAGFALKQQIGEVVMTGTISGGAPGTVAYTFPLGYRPLYRTDLAVYGGTVRIDPDGKLYVLTGTPVSLDQIRFTASP